MTPTPSIAKQKTFSLAFLALFAIALTWSAIGPRDRFTWYLEVAPAVAAAVILTFTFRRFRFTTLTNFGILLHAFILLVGGHYTYAEVPLFNWLRDAVHLSRNHYDRVGHFAQGFVPALVARELLLRTSPLRPGRWLFTLVTCVCLAISAAYELIEWLTAVLTGEAAQAFLGTQGDVWDTQADMAMALIGALVAQIWLSRRQDRAIAEIVTARATPP